MSTHQHTYPADALSGRDHVDCTSVECTHTETRCEWSTSWPWECDHCKPFPAPALLPSVAPAAPMRVAHPVRIRPATPTPPTSPARDIERKHLREASTADLVVDLVEHTTHHEPYTIQRRNPDGTHTLVTERWATTNPPLLEQLGTAVSQSAAVEEGPRAGFASKPAARIDAIDALARITRDVERWLLLLSLPVPYVRGAYGAAEVDLMVGVRRVAAAVSLDDRIARDVRSWWIVARTVTGWDSAAWRPRVACPNCEYVGDLRIRLDVKTAVCVNCWAEWDETTIGILADHISAEERKTAQEAAEAEELGA